MDARAQSSVELLIVLAVSLAVLGVLIQFTSDQLSALQKDNAVRTAQQSMQTLVEAINRTYAQGPGSISTVELEWPRGISESGATISGRSIQLRVLDTDVAGTAVPLITGSLSTSPGTQIVRIVAHDSNVQLGTNYLSSSVASVYIPMAQDTNQSAHIVISNLSSDAATLSLSLLWSSSLASATLSSSSGSIPGGGTFAFDVRASAEAGAIGNYVGFITVSGTYPSAVDGVVIPVNIEVYPNSDSLLTTVPDSLAFENYSTDSNTLALQVCNTSTTPMHTLSFTPSSGNAGDWVQGIASIPTLGAESCTSVDVTVTPASGVPGTYSGSLLVKDYTGANTIVVPLSVHVLGQSSFFAWDWSTATTGGDNIKFFTLSNTGTHDSTITGITLSGWWACDSAHSDVTSYVLNANPAYSGVKLQDGNFADVDDTPITAGDSWNQNGIYFDNTIDDEGEQFIATVQFSDGSSYVSPQYGSGCSADVTPPARVTDLAAFPGPTPGSVRLTWTFPGDDNFSGTPVRGVLRYSLDSVASGAAFAAAANTYSLTAMLPGGSAGSLVLTDLNIGHKYNFALTFMDEVDQNGGISNQANARPWNRFRYSLSQFPAYHFVWSTTNVGDLYAGDSNLFRVSDLVTSGSTDRNIVLRVVDDFNSDNSWIAYLYYTSSRLRRLQIWYPGLGYTGIPPTTPNFDANYNIAISTPFDLNDNVLITGGWNYSGGQVGIPPEYEHYYTTTLYVDVFQGFSDMNIAADDAAPQLQQGG